MPESVRLLATLIWSLPEVVFSESLKFTVALFSVRLLPNCITAGTAEVPGAIFDPLPATTSPLIVAPVGPPPLMPPPVPSVSGVGNDRIERAAIGQNESSVCR